MGRYFASGIPISFSIYCEGKKDKEDLNKLKQHLSKYFNLDVYDIDDKTYSNSFKLTMKKDFLEENIHECLMEINEVTELEMIDDMFSDLNKKILFKNHSKEFCQKNYPITLKWNKHREKYYLDCEEITFDQTLNFCEPFWLYRNNDLLGRNKYRVDMDLILLWLNDDKMDTESETNLLYVVNNMKKNFYKNPLAKNIVYFIYG